jgi:uncharacterized protein with ParB-like and HNH nuclease domain
VHFIGSVVHIDEGLGNLAVQAPKLVIDGQQRLTTVTLLLTALADVLDGLPEDQQEPIEEFAPAIIRETYLTRRHQKGDKRFKLLLSDTDRATLMALVDPTAAALPAEPSIRIQENHQFFLEQLRAPTTDLAVVCRGISKLLVVDVALSRDQDNPQLIFESMNSTGRELSQADLIRNYVLMGQPPELQERLYTLHWRPMEQAFGQEAYSGNEFSAFMRDFLTLKTAEVPRLDLVYEVFKQYERQPAVEQAGIEACSSDLHTTAIRYCRMALGQGARPQLRDAFHDLRELKVNVVTPLLLELYGDHEAGLLSRDELLEALRCWRPTCSAGRSAPSPPTPSRKPSPPSAAPCAENGHYLPSFKAHLLDLPSYRRFPSDEEFRRDLQIRNLYKFNKSCSYWLRRLENHQRKEPIAVADYTIEHILPQNPDLSAAWREALGPTGPSCRRSGCIASATSPSPATTPSSAITLPRQARPPRGRLPHQSPAPQPGPGPAGALGCGCHAPARGDPRRTRPGGVGFAPAERGAAPGLPATQPPPARWLHPRRPSAAGQPPDPGGLRRTGRPHPGSGSKREPGGAQALHRLQGRDQLRRHRSPGQTAAPQPQHALSPSSTTPRAWPRT